MNKTIYASLFLIIVIQSTTGLFARSIHRPDQSWMPRLEVDWSGEETRKHILQASHLEQAQILTKYDKDYLLGHQLPHTPIQYRNKPHESTTGKKLDTLINRLVTEINEHKKEYTDFIELKNKDFNKPNRCGLIVLRFKDYPFVLKLFMERPESFVKPCSKGWQPYFFYYMSGGISRHLMGFTRIKNLEIIRNLIAQDPYWKQIIDTPRKWFWLPENPRSLTIRAYNFNGIEKQVVEIPSTYGIVTDLIIPKKELSLRSKSSRRLGIKLSRVVGNRIDPHMGNFMIEEKTPAVPLNQENETARETSIALETDIYLDTKTEKIVLIDTEHFPSLVGLKKPLEFDGYLSWYLQLMSKFAQEKFFTTKQYRKYLQKNPQQIYLAL